MSSNVKQSKTNKASKLARKLAAAKLTGSGDYLSDIKAMLKPMVKSALKSGLESAGEAAGSHVGMGDKGRKLGGLLAGKISRLLGSGDYSNNFDRVKVNSIIKGKADANASFSQRGYTVSRREYIGDLIASATPGNFSNTTYTVNANNASLFSQLCNIASCYERYRFRGLVVEIISATSSNTAAGTYGVCMSYNPAVLPFISKNQMENSDDCLSARIDKDLMYGVECEDQTNNWLLVNQPGITAGSQTDYNFGLLQVMSQPSTSVAANANLGEIWITYDVEFENVRVPVGKYGYAHARLTSFIGINQPVTAYGCLSTATYTPISVTQGQITLPNMEVGDVFTVAMSVSGTVLGAPIIGTFVNCAGANLYRANSVSSMSATNTTGFESVINIFMTITSSAAPATFLLSLGSTTITTIDIVVNMVSAGISSSFD